MAKRKNKSNDSWASAPAAESSATSEKVGKYAKILLGTLIILAGLFLIWLFLPEFIFLIKGVIGVILILVGILVVALGWLD